MEQAKKFGHPQTRAKLIEEMYNEAFINSVAEKIPQNLCEKENKERTLKISTFEILTSNVDKWLESTRQMNACIATELSLPCLEYKEEPKTQAFNWINCSPNKGSLIAKIFLPPTDIIINPTGWFPDPIYSYSLIIGIELKVISNNDLKVLTKDIQKGIYFLNWRRKYLQTYKRPELPDCFKHIYGEYEQADDCFFFIIMCCCDINQDQILSLFSSFNEISIAQIFSTKGKLCFVKMTLNNFNCNNLPLGC